MASTTKEVEQLLQLYRKACDSSNSFKNPNLAECKKLLSQLKIKQLQFNLVPPFGNNDIELVRRQLLIARETLELATILSILSKDVDAFERHVTQVKIYYFDFAHLIPESDRQWPILALDLLGLLAHNRIAEFHTDLERVPQAARGNMYIKYPVQLEQKLMEGSYNKVLSARQLMPLPYYGHFMDMLAGTVREKISDCSERAYETLPAGAAQKLLMLNNEQELLEYCKERGWEVEDGVVSFNNKQTENLDIPATPLIAQTVGYAVELERIV